MCDMLSKDSHAYFQLVFRLVWCEDFYLLTFHVAFSVNCQFGLYFDIEFDFQSGRKF